MRLFIKLLAGGLVAGLAAVAFMLYYQYRLFEESSVQIPSGETTVFEVKPGSNIRQVARQLDEAGILPRNPFIDADLLLVAQARLTETATRIKAGEYELEAGMKPLDILERFVGGKTLQYQLGIVEGRTFKELVQSVRSNPSLVQTLTDTDYQNLLPKLGGSSGMAAEGWFFPDTYNFPRGTSDLDVLKRSYQTMQDYLLKAWDGREPHPLIKTPYEALILASIVEKETGMPDERPMIARVFLTRLEKGMMLQTDPTVIYGLGDAYDGNIRKKDLQTDTPWNTYTRTGLPPTPIATPSKAAIDAVLHPAATPYLYFVATGTGDGRHYFSESYDEHRKAVNQYLQNDKANQASSASGAVTQTGSN